MVAGGRGEGIRPGHEGRGQIEGEDALARKSGAPVSLETPTTTPLWSLSLPRARLSLRSHVKMLFDVFMTVSTARGPGSTPAR